MITVVKISRPMGSLKCPLSASTFATSPRLDSDRMASQSQSLSEIEVEGETDFKKVRRENEGDEQ